MESVENGQQRSQQEQKPLLSGSEGSRRYCGARWQLLLVVAVAVILGVTLGVYFGVTSSDNDGGNGGKNHNDNTLTTNRMFGEWPYYASEADSHHRQSNSSINSSTFDDLAVTCLHTLSSDTVTKGHLTIDDDKNAYWADSTGHICSLDIRSCRLNWRRDIAELLGYDPRTVRLQNYEPPTLYLDSKGEKRLIFGTPNDGRVNYSDLDPVWAVSISVLDGTLIWKTALDEGYTATCAKSHGFIVDNQGYAFGGISLDCPGAALDSPAITGAFQGKFYKLDVEDGSIVDIWYSYPTSFVRNENDTNNTYKSAGVWGAPSILGDWISFGTANLFSYPDYIDDCFQDFDNYYHNNDSSQLKPTQFENNPIDPCGRNLSLENEWYHCLEKDVYPSSLIVLDRLSMMALLQQPSNGLDAWNKYCRNGGTPGEICPLHQGPDADISAVGMWTDSDTNQSYVTALGKNGFLLQYELPSGQLSFSIKLGPWSTSGGGRWGVGIDPLRKLAVARITGGNPSQIYRQTLADGRVTCRTGITFIVDLLSGHVKYQLVCPFGYIGNDVCNNQTWTSVLNSYEDMTKDNSCNVGSDGESIPDIEDSGAKVIIPDRPSDASSDASSTSDIPVAIANDLVFVAWDAFVFAHSLDDGSVKGSVRCPDPESYVQSVTVISEELLVFCRGDPSMLLVYSL